MNNQSSTLLTKISNFEKRLLPWKAFSLKKGRPAFFPGCNLVNFLPNTSMEAISVLEKLECGWIFDCCGKPLILSGDKVGFGKVLERTEKLILEYGIPEVIVACPNCHQVFKKYLSVPVTDIYEYLRREGYSIAHEPGEMEVFSPCPDRASGIIAESIGLLTGNRVVRSENLPCCGLGIKQPDRQKKALETIKVADLTMKAYCASCYGHLKMNGVNITGHVLTEILGLEEIPSTGIEKIFNRFRLRFR